MRKNRATTIRISLQPFTIIYTFFRKNMSVPPMTHTKSTSFQWTNFFPMDYIRRVIFFPQCMFIGLSSDTLYQIDPQKSDRHAYAEGDRFAALPMGVSCLIIRIIGHGHVPEGDVVS